MASRTETALDALQDNLDLAIVPLVATLLSTGEIVRALEAGRGGGFTFPFPVGVPTLWTYVALPDTPGGTGAGVVPFGFPGFVAVLIFGILLTAAMEAGLLGTIASRLKGPDRSFFANVKRYLLPIIGVNLVRAAITFGLGALFVVSPVLGLPVFVFVMYLLYGWSFVVITSDGQFIDALETTVAHATRSIEYAAFGVTHLIAGAVASAVLTPLVLNYDVLGLLVGIILVPLPALFVATYGVLLFFDLGNRPIHV